jgi:tetratricopeptide (TPR) repeat protein
MEALLDAWTRSRGGDGQFVTVVGDAGVGKSRIISELLEQIAASGDVHIVRSRCLSYGQSIGLWLISDLLRTLFQIGEGDGLDEVRSTLRRGIADLLGEGPGEDALAETLDVLGEVLGLPPGGSALSNAGAQIRRQALVRDLRLIVAAIAHRQPAVFVLEDLHWIDPASQEVLTEIMAAVPGLPLLVLAGQRPGWTALWAEWGWPERIVLRPLGDEDAAALAGAVLGGARLSPELMHYVTERAGGNPFFVEEMLRALHETGAVEERDGEIVLLPGAAERLPTKLTELLQARLDRLDLEVRGIAQVASVIGRNFTVRLLSQMMHWEASALHPPLSALQKAEIVFPRHSADLEYVFKHVSMREAAYHTLLQKRRRHLHLEAARAVAALYPPEEYVEMIAYHYSRTDEHADAAAWLERAGDRAAAIYASELAIGHYREARLRLERSGAAGEDFARLDEKHGTVLYTAGRYDESLEPLARAAEVCQQAGRLESAGRTVALIGMAHRYRGTPEEGILEVHSMLELLHDLGPSEAVASLHIALASLYFLTGKYRETRVSAETAAEIARTLGNDRLLGEAEERRGTALLLLGESDEALRVLESALPLVERGGDFVVLWRALNNTATVCEKLGQMDRVRDYTLRALDVAERMGNPSRTAFILANLGSTLITLGDWTAARTQLDHGMDLAVTAGHAADAAIPLQYLGQLCLWQGNLGEASKHLREGLLLAQQSGDRQNLEMVEAFLAELDLIEGRSEIAKSRLDPLLAQDDATLGVLLPISAWAHLELGDLARAAEIARDAVDRARANGEVYHAVHALWVQARVLTEFGHWDLAGQAVTEGLDLARSMPFPYLEARLLRADGLLAAARGEPGRALERLEHAIDIFRRLGAGLDAESTEAARLNLLPERITPT